MIGGELRRKALAVAALATGPLLAGCGQQACACPPSRPSPSAPADPAGTRIFTVDPSRSWVSYTVTEHVPTISRFHPRIGTFRVTGRAPVRAGSIHLAPNPGASSVRGVSVDPLRLRTDQSFRDQMLDPQLVDALSPLAVFDSTATAGAPATLAEGQAVRFRLIGTLKIHGISRAVTLDATATIRGATLTADATTAFAMTDFGVTPPSGIASTVDPPVTLDVHLVATAAG
jgi:polyisoprenoid-binding protein YceI